MEISKLVFGLKPTILLVSNKRAALEELHSRGFVLASEKSVVDISPAPEWDEE